MRIYFDYAPIYAAIGQGAFAEYLAQRVLRQYTPWRALDLACGAGAAALTFAAAGHTVTGLDQSPRMLALARAQAEQRGLNARFIHGDMRRLDWYANELPAAGFDLVTCFYDSLNYLIGDDDLRMVCSGVGRVLQPGGLFIFDLNTEAEFETWNDIDQVVYDGHECMVYNRLSYDMQQRLATGRIIWFTRAAERWRRGEETHIERAWSDAEVMQALRASDMQIEALQTPAGEPAGANAPRIVYIARRTNESHHRADFSNVY